VCEDESLAPCSDCSAAPAQLRKLRPPDTGEAPGALPTSLPWEGEAAAKPWLVGSCSTRSLQGKAGRVALLALDVFPPSLKSGQVGTGMSKVGWQLSCELASWFFPVVSMAQSSKAAKHL